MNVTLALCVSLLAVMGITQTFRPGTSAPSASQTGGWLDFILLPCTTTAIAMLRLLFLPLLGEGVVGREKAVHRVKGRFAAPAEGGGLEEDCGHCKTIDNQEGPSTADHAS